MKNTRTEIIAGITTFLTMSYIVLVNPSILATECTGLTFSGVLTATVILSFSMTLFMGLYAKLPFGVAPGMGINAFFTYTLVLGQQIPWQTALGMVFWSGVIFLLASATPLRVAIANAIPENLRSAVAVGIGIFLSFIGLKNAGLIQSHPVTFVTLGKLGIHQGIALGSFVLMAFLLRRKSPFAFLAGIGGATILAWVLGLTETPDHFLSAPDFSSVFLKLDIWESLKWSLLPAIITLSFTDLFDSISTFVGVSKACGLVEKNGEPKNLRQGLLVDAFATLVAGPLGTSSGTAYIESAAGIEAGGRTGLTAVVTALCFLPCLFFAPLAQMVPPYATAPVLILVGFLMFQTVSQIHFSTIEESVPPFLTILLIPLTFSITQGILWGFVSHVVLFVLAGRHKQIPPMMYALALLSVGLLFIS